ncbi:MAG: hypothetical protein DRI86_12380 [Bacteroidetes bacterium]|nr:MAG: hypothetical protein DRI86_12380 [Bacteroidota bacterium]
MSGGKETPRQKMIGMMYLFYTALLALNISSDILNAFILVNDSMVQTNTNFGSKNELILNAFEKQMSMNEKKVKPYYEKAMKAKEYSEELVKYLNWLNDTIISATEYGGGDGVLESSTGEDSIIPFNRLHEIPVVKLHNKDKYNVPQGILIPEIPGVTKQADVMKEKFAEFNEKILGLLTDKDKKDIKLGLQTDKAWNAQEKKWEEWEHNTFHHGVLIADIVIINKYISEVLNTEAEVLNKLYSYIDAQTIKFDAVRAAVIPKSTVIISGGEYEADIFVAAYSKTEVPFVDIKKGSDSLTLADVKAGGDNLIHIDSASNGIVKFKVKANSIGEFKYAGFINVKGPDGKFQQHFFHSSYQVIKPTATVSADKVNVVYKGIPNPITASASGFTNDQLSVSVRGGGSLKPKGDGHYMYTPSRNGKEVSFIITAKKSDGSSQSFPPAKFRVLPVPPPTIRLAGKSEGAVDRAVLASSSFLTANLDGFLFELKYRVTQFEIIATGKKGVIVNQTVRGNKLPKSIINKLRKSPRGTIIIVSGVKTVGDDGAKRAPGITLKIK